MTFHDKNLIIKTSTLANAGNGLFTTVDIPKGSRITEYKGRRTNWADVENDSDNGYVFYIDDDTVIDAGRTKTSLARYANDAMGLTRIKDLKNNSKYVNEDDRIYIDATKDIPAGSEIFVGYGKAYWDTIRDNIRSDKEEAKQKEAKAKTEKKPTRKK